VLYPGLAAGRRVALLDRLRPGQGYVVEGARERETVADRAGQVRLTIDLDGRRALSLRPA